MKIARIVLNIGSKISQVPQPQRWDFLRNQIRKTFLSDPKVYVQRITALMDMAMDKEPDCIVLPAEALPITKDWRLTSWASILPKDTVIVAGTLNFREKEEGLVVLKGGEILAEVWGMTIHGLDAGFHLIPAVSTATKMASDAYLAFLVGNDQRQLLIATLGHHQYSPARASKIFTKALVQTAKDHNLASASLVVSWWIIPNSETKFPWAWKNNKAGPPELLHYDRTLVPFLDNGGYDFIDILEP